MAPKGSNKKPHIAVPPHVAKKPVIATWPTDDESRVRVSWRLGDMEFEGPWSWQGIKATKWRDILKLLAQLERLTWAEASSGAKPRVKNVRISDGPAGVADRLAEIKRDDTSELCEVHMSGLQRIWGVRRGNVFHLLWWDPHHKVWPSKLKHT